MLLDLCRLLVSVQVCTTENRNGRHIYSELLLVANTVRRLLGCSWSSGVFPLGEFSDDSRRRCLGAFSPSWPSSLRLCPGGGFSRSRLRDLDRGWTGGWTACRRTPSFGTTAGMIHTAFGSGPERADRPRVREGMRSAMIWRAFGSSPVVNHSHSPWDCHICLH